jgi:two-component system, OmpR family, response regulator
MADMRVRRVLVVDDDPDLREMFVALIEQYGIAVDAASSAEEALALVDASTPDLVFLDIAMPTTSGADLARTLRAKNPSLRLVAVSGYDPAHVRTLGTFDDVLSKPVDIASLEALLRS